MVNAKVKVYFLDDSGDVITTLAGWVCPRGSQVFTLPVVNDLAGPGVGALRVESQSHDQVASGLVDPPHVHSTVRLVKHGADTPVEAMTCNALPSQLVANARVLALPATVKDAQGVTSQIAIQNINPDPGFAQFAMFFTDEAGLVEDRVVCGRLNERQVG